MCKCKQAVPLKFKRLNPAAQIPAYQTEGAAGFDLAAAEEVLVFPGQTVVVKTGLACAIPPGYEMQIRPRSGVSLKTPLLIKNSPGTIDCDYRGDIGVIVHNCTDPQQYGHVPYVIKVGARIAQGVIKPVIQASIEEVEELDETVRGIGGFGSTGINGNV